MRPDILVKYNSLISFIFNYDFTSCLFCNRTTYERTKIKKNSKKP